MDDTVTLVGNLVRDPELKYTPSGQAVLNFTIARNNRRRNDDGTWEDGDPGFYDVAVWGEQAENMGESIEKGMRVMVYGNLQFDKWEDKDTGKNRSAVKIRANEVAASMRWTTVQVNRRERTGPADQPQASSQRVTVPNVDDEPF